MDFENVLYNADGLWINDTAFSMMNESDEYIDLLDQKIYFFEWYTSDGLTFTIKCTDTAIKNAKILDAKRGIIEVLDIDDKPFTIQILFALNLTQI